MDPRPAPRTLGRDRDRGFRSSFGPIAAILLALASALAWPAGAVAQSDDTFPLSVTDDEGTSITLEARPERIVSLSPANTETVFALGGGDRLLGGTDFDDYPPEAADLADVATFAGVIMERVVELEPDLVLAAGNAFTPPDDIDRLRQLGYPVVVLYAEDVPGVLHDIELIGSVIGEAAAATAMTDGMRADLDTVSKAAAATGSRPRTFYELGSEPEIYGPAPDSFIADMVALAGGEPITTGDPAVFAIPLEELVVADPEVIVVGDANYGVCPVDVAGRPGWGDMTAVREGAIRAVDDIPVTRPGPRLAAGLASLARAIHPDLALPGFPPEPAICAAS